VLRNRDSHLVDRNGNKVDHPGGNGCLCNPLHVAQIDPEPLMGNLLQSVSTG
jgi:nitrate reductase cytochrome c-type subunit